MTVTSPGRVPIDRPRPQGRVGHRALSGRATLVGAVLLASTVLGVATAVPGMLRTAIALAAAAVLVAACLRSPGRALIALIVWLVALGTVRRLLLPSGGGSQYDPLLLVAPTVAGLLVLVAARRHAFSAQTMFTKSILVLTGLIVLAAVNPLQGGLSAGAGGLLFVLVPVLWFWIGRGVVDDALLAKILRLVSFLSLVAAGYGLFQAYRGFPTWDQRWIDVRGYAALRIGQAVRPFASFSSASEYVGFLAIGMVLWASKLRKGERLIMPALAVTLLGWALALASVRGALVVVPIALGMTFAASRGFRIGKTILVGCAALFVLGFIVSRLHTSQVGGNQTSALVSHQIVGLSDPFDPQKSTLPVHIQALAVGLGDGIRNPAGRGLGVITIAGQKFGAEDTSSTDIDPSNVAVAMGIAGLLVYTVVVYLAMRMSFRRARESRDYLVIATLGVALVTLLQWLNGGNYAVAPMPWLLLGWLDRQYGSVRARSVTSGVRPRLRTAKSAPGPLAAAR